MHIRLENISKRYGFEWIVRQVSFQFESGRKYAVTGPNGSGKSTLLKIISGGLTPTSGRVQYSLLHNRVTDAFEAAREISFAAPYISLVEEFTLEELYAFHASFKTMIVSGKDEFLERSGLYPHRKKYIRNFSSGMKQRLKLSLAFFTESKALLLDEPTSNFDAAAIEWYHQLIEKHSSGRLVIIGSNQPYEYACCDALLPVVNFK
jgi:ABC-type multidrug transport system ATPase subunit